MGKFPQVDVELRSERKKGAMGRLRRAGKVPAIIYGREVDNQLLSFSVDRAHAVTHAHGIVELVVAGGEVRPVLVRHVQRDYLKQTILHVDFQLVRMDEKIRNAIPVSPLGHPMGEVKGGVLEQFMFQVEVECLPADLPDLIEVDVSGLDVEQIIAVSKLPLPPNVVAVYNDPDMPVFACAIPRAETEATATEEAEGVEPEVIEKGKKVEEGAAGAEAKK